ncbi:MAG TPA: stage V sporulation protein AE [Firmicutes bacterium]|uniref:Stage V sporulation protein AE n=1 Tax=Candidatus Fermentithermobacillus carboniphilus TaxID=3085328 RepID=A0AAT9LCT3_9FIRM|nr:MAG: stage V sporulation protein AE [Candidatus Fermentithermobacillus carboniphilus]HHW17959.1 stage V sporulation protein AE [Candidatus Fermentithermobacillaceae bacterium]
MTYIKAFVVGGVLCAIAQFILDITKVNPALIMVSFVSAGAILSGLGIYGPLVKLGGAGATIPLTGFGHTLVTGMLEDAAKMGWFGLLTGGLRAASSGLTAAILFGYLMAVLFNPKG